MKFRVNYVTIYVSNPKDDTLVKYKRPALQVKVLFFWITIKKFLYDDGLRAFRDAEKVCNMLNKEGDL